MKVFMEQKDALLKRLKVESEVGLTREQAAENAKTYGANEFTKDPPISLARRIFEAASEPMLVMLILAGLIALGVNTARAVTGGEADFLECVGIFLAISLSVVITVIMEGKSEKAFEALSRINEDVEAKVIRDGQVQMIPQREIVVGDILSVETGDKLSADGRLLESIGLCADESSLTGEGEPVEKDSEVCITREDTPVAERINMLYSGSYITGGHGTMVVTDVGDRTEFGKIARELSSTEKSSTPLQEKLARLGKFITVLGASAALVVFLLQVILFVLDGTASLDTISEAFITSIVLIVAAVPEGLPTIVAVSLSVQIIKMSKQNALVKKMIACETVGCIDVVCSDKTGTLTENKMAVSHVYSRGQMVEPADLGDGDLLFNFCVNSTADVNFENGQKHFIGNPTECALLTVANGVDWDYRSVRQNAEVVYAFPFSSETKCMTTIVCQSGVMVAYTKGSPEKVIAMCRMEDGERKRAEEAIYSFQSQAGRVIAFAHSPISQSGDFENYRAEIESNLVFDGFVSISDPLRGEVPEAVAKCRAAGIDIKMLTGDNLVTAMAIAGKLDLLDEDHVAVEAGELEKLTDEELKKRLPFIRVIARSTPIIKMRVVNALKSTGHIVAVTGDGINDAPAIRNADVGIAMGIAGTEVSKAASDIVLLDDSFATIVKAVQWGRGIYENFQRFIQFQLTVNLSSVIVVLFTILAGMKAPFTALQLLWINIIMDGPPALTLGLEPIREDLMSRRPTGRNEAIVSKQMLWRISTNGLFISVLFLLQHGINFLGAKEAEMETVLFTLFVLFQLFNAFNSRELGNASILRHLGRNRLMLAVFALTFGLQVLITQYGAVFFGTVALPLAMWIKMIATAFTVILFAEVVRFLKKGIAR